MDFEISVEVSINISGTILIFSTEPRKDILQQILCGYLITGKVNKLSVNELL